MIAELTCLTVLAFGGPAASPIAPAPQHSGTTTALAYHSSADEPPAKDRKQADKTARDRDAILGTWQVVKVEEDGKDVSQTDRAKEFQSGPWTITRNKIVLKAGVREMNYELDPFAKPKTLDMDNGGDKKLDCVYSLDGDTLRICAPVNPGGTRPAEVDSAKGSGTRLLTLKRKPKD